MTTRPVQATDEPFLFELFAATKGAEMSAWGLPPPQMAQLLQMQYHAQRRSYEAQYPGADHRILLKGDEPIGRVWVSRSPHEIVLVDIALLPQFRGTGAGTRLIQALQAEAAEACVPLRLQVAANNPRAAQLYERLGFREIHVTETHQSMQWP